MWQPIAAEELAELGQGHPTLRQEVCADKEFQEDYQGADDPNIKMQPTGEGRKPELKTLKKCPSPEKSHVAAKKHVRWADWEEERRQKRILCNRTRFVSADSLPVSLSLGPGEFTVLESAHLTNSHRRQQNQYPNFFQSLRGHCYMPRDDVGFPMIGS